MSFDPVIKQQPAGWEPTFIDWRASLARAVDRYDAPLCHGCGCETDVEPVPHSPRCKENTNA